MTDREGASAPGFSDYCEWNPDLGVPATDDAGCVNEAVWLLGSNGLWRVCDYCSKLDEFRKLRKRVRIKRESGDG